MRCRTCQLMAVANVPEDLSPYYAKGYFTGDVSLEGYMDYEMDKEVTKKTYKKYLDLIGARLDESAGVSMFEVGCATGYFMALARKRGWDTEGIDISEYAVKESQARDLRVTVGTLETYVSDKKFDVVVMQDVIEHVKNPVDTIDRAAAMMKDNGLLVLTTPDAGSLWARSWGKRWHAFVPPQHLFYFSVKNITNLLERQGIQVIYVSHHGKWFSIPYIFRLLHSWTGVSIFSRLASGAARTFLKKVALPINVHDTIFLIARKIT